MALGWRKEYSRYRGFFLNIFDFYKQRRDLMMFLEILLSIVTIALFSVFALKPTAITIIELNKEIQTKEEVVDKMDVKLADLKKAQANYSRETARIKILDTAVPSKPSPETFVRQLQGVAYYDAASLQSVSLNEVALLGDAKVKKTKNLEELPTGAQGISFYISLNGNFQTLSTLLTDLEFMRRPIKINSLSITTQKKEELSSDNLNFTLSGQVPYLLEK